MNEMEQMEHDINGQMGLIGRFEHPSVDKSLVDRIVGRMVEVRGHRQRVRWVIGLTVPLAAAAGIALATMLFVYGGKNTVSKSGGLITRTGSDNSAVSQSEIVAIWSQGLEVGAKAVFADLDFDSATSQPAYLIFENNTANTTTDDLDKYLIEELAKTPS